MFSNSAYWIGCLIGLVLHEAAHALMALSLGLKVRRFGVNWRGPYTVRQLGTPLANIAVISAGPLINLLLAIATWKYSAPFAAANLVLGIGNLVPTPSSDGMKLIREFRLARAASLGDAIAEPSAE